MALPGIPPAVSFPAGTGSVGTFPAGSAPVRTFPAGRGRVATRGFDADRAVLVVDPAQRGGEAVGRVPGDLEFGLPVEDADAADFPFRDMAAPADQGDEPARVGVAVAADIHLEPHRVLGPGGTAAWGALGAAVEQLLGLGQARPMEADQGRGDVLGGTLGQKRATDGAILLRGLLGPGGIAHQPLPVLCPD